MNYISQPTISINSECNNNCEYCYISNNNKNKKDILSYKDIVEIIKWIKQSYNYVIIMGGEPLLHPDLIKIMEYLSKELEGIKLITNLISKNENLIQKLAQIRNLKFLINTTTNKKYKNIFNKNLNILIQNSNSLKNIVFSLTYTGREKQDNYYTDNLISIIEKVKDFIPINLRISPYLPQGDYTYNLYNYDTQIDYLIQNIKTTGIIANISFDCSFNFCFASKNTILKLAKETNLTIDKPLCQKAPFIDIKPNKKVYFCYFVTDKYFPPKYFYEFASPDEYIKYFTEIKENFIKNNQYLCKTDEKNCPKYCPGVCPGILIKIKDNKFIDNCRHIPALTAIKDTIP